MIGGMNDRSLSAPLVPDRPTLDGIEAKWARAWERDQVVQV
jgi:hypothetical protein